MAGSILEHYFDELLFEHVEYRDQYAIYGAKVPSLFQNECRYVFALIDTSKNRSPLRRSGRLSALPWVSCQTRLIARDKDRYKRKLKEHHSWRVEAKARDIKLNVASRSKDRTEYMSEDGSLKVSLMHDSKNPPAYQHHNRIMLSTAVETFKCICVKI